MTADELDDLIVLASSGDMDALERLYAELKGLVYAMALSIVRSRTPAEDITQDTFVHIAQARGFQPQGNGRAWVLRITRNLSLRYLQLQQRQNAPSVERNVSAQEEAFSLDRLLLREALERLNAVDRQIVLLHTCGLKHQEIAQIIHRPAATVRWRYAQAIQKLSKILRRMDGDDH